MLSVKSLFYAHTPYHLRFVLLAAKKGNDRALRGLLAYLGLYYIISLYSNAPNHPGVIYFSFLTTLEEYLLSYSQVLHKI